MKYTKQQRAILARVFAAALEKLSPTNHGMGEFICHCIVSAVGTEKNYLTSEHGQLAKDLILERLAGRTNLTDWFMDHSGIDFREINRDYRQHQGRKHQETRKAWLESLIKEFSS